MNQSFSKTGAIYVRVSTARQDEHELSPDSQIQLALDYANKNQILIPEEYIFHEKGGISGKHAEKRPYFQQMIALAKSESHPIDVILVWKYSRFARNQEESIVYKTMLRKNCGVDVVSISEPLAEGPFGSLIERIIEWMDEYYVIRLSGEVTRGMAENARRGNYQARPPLGYRIVHKGEPPVLVPEEAELVQLIFHLYAREGQSMLEICRRLNEMGARTSQGKAFEKRSVSYILQNISYTGKVRWNRTENETHRIRPREEWIIAQGKQPAIISDELFETAKARMARELAKRAQQPKRQKPSASVTHYLSGLLKCSACGRSLSAARQYSQRSGCTYCHFQCYGYLKGKCGTSHSISEKKIVSALFTALTEVIDSCTTEFELPKTQSAPLPKADAFLRCALEKLDRKEARIKQAYRDGIDTIEEYKEQKELLKQERDTLKQQLERLECQEQTEQEIRKPPSHPELSPGQPGSEEQAKEGMPQRISSVCEILQNPFVPVSKKNDALKSIIEKIVYHKAENKITVYFAATPVS